MALRQSNTKSGSASHRATQKYQFEISFKLYPNETYETFTFPIMCEGVDKSPGGKDVTNTAEKIIDFMDKHFGDCAKEWF